MVVVVVALALGAGCAKGTREIRRGDVTLWIVDPAAGEQDAVVGGVVVYLEEHECFVLASDSDPLADPDAYHEPVFWPVGTRIVDVEERRLDVPGLGEVRPGDEVYGGGGYWDPPPEHDIADACFGSSGDVAYMDRAGG